MTVTLKDIFTPANNRLLQYFNEDLGLELKEQSEIIEHDKIIDLYTHSVLINVSGDLNGGFILSSDDNLAYELITLFSEVQLSKKEQAELLGEALAESLNIIIGNSYHLIPTIKEDIKISPPFGLEQTALIKNYKKAQTITKIFSSSNGKLSLTYINYNETRN